jgi:hypothetical protein
MRVLHCAALSAAALLLASVVSAQGLGDAAAREREKRKATPAKPAKVYTENDIGRSMAPVSATEDLPATAPEGTAGQAGAQGQAAAEGQPAPLAEGEPATEGEAPPEGEAGAEGQPAPAAPTAAEKAAEEERARAEANWRRSLDIARKQEAAYKDVINKLQFELNDISAGVYSANRAAKIALLDDTKQKLAATQGQIAHLEDEGKRNNYK